jgi:hypothetical protein
VDFFNIALKCWSIAFSYILLQPTLLIVEWNTFGFSHSKFLCTIQWKILSCPVFMKSSIPISEVWLLLKKTCVQDVFKQSSWSGSGAKPAGCWSWLGVTGGRVCAVAFGQSIRTWHMWAIDITPPYFGCVVLLISSVCSFVQWTIQDGARFRCDIQSSCSWRFKRWENVYCTSILWREVLRYIHIDYWWVMTWQA